MTFAIVDVQSRFGICEAAFAFADRHFVIAPSEMWHLRAFGENHREV